MTNQPVHDIPPLSDYARSVIDRLGLEAHPEGGWYVRDWQSASLAPADCASATQPATATTTGDRPLASLIYFLLPKGDFSAWHQVDADELWLWHGPAQVTLELAGDGDTPNPEAAHRITLGAGLRTDADAESSTAPGDEPVNAPVIGHVVVPAGVWQRTIPGDGDALVSCVVSPGFTFAGFTLARR
ncbi:cupin domain-containing protein [Bifidobacterium sp. 82T24]|uniref:cupin domain-containing protein n=1 Tax=Bifidobacterium pluvialisilvae TaxID=2834436 RepID=UPI001C57EE1B|nr:cupin domain-containing protein [Bifidobacterium pluvialisilvae]MBW3088040.1 cupin domain-containing protein [Bifidobacterium pluvialisilvae]